MSLLFIPLSLPPLPYSYEALEPVLSADLMELHHRKHHQAYVDGYNAALAQLQAAPPQTQLATLLRLLPVLEFNGGGHLNHSLFWESLAPPGKGGAPSPELAAAIHASFGSMEAFQQQMEQAGLKVRGSGWVWLGYAPSEGSLQVATTMNQTPLTTTTDLVPLLGIDVWEHAYYLSYQNRRGDYLQEIWKVIDWDAVSQRYADLRPRPPQTPAP